MTKKLPVNGTWLQNNESDVLGTLTSSFNLNPVEIQGATMISPRLMITTDNLSGLGTTCAFQTFTDQNAGIQYYWGVSGKFMWRARTDTAGYITAFAKDSSTGTPGGVGPTDSCADDLSDLVVYNTSYMVLSLNSGIYFYDGVSTGQWFNVQNGAVSVTTTGGVPHLLCVFGGRVYITDSNLAGQNLKIRSFTVPFTSAVLTTSGANFLDLSVGAYPVTIITKLISGPDGIWICTVNQSENGCYMFKWDGVTNNVVTPYEIKDANGIMTGIIIDNVPWVIDNNGRLLYFNGGAFVEAKNGKLPAKPKKLLTNALSGTNNRFVHPNGISLYDGRINILVNNKYNDSLGTIEETLPSGIWEYDDQIGWYHKSALSLYLQNGGTITDFGQNRLATVGALYIHKTNAATSTTDGTMLVGAQYYSDASATRYGIWTDNSNDTLQKGGYIVTDKIFGDSLEDIFTKAFIQIKPLINGTDSIQLKFMISDMDSTEITVTWTSTTSFTTTDANILNYAISDEVEGTQGKGSGQTGHITAISGPVTGTYTVTTTTFTGVGTSGTAKVRLQHWMNTSVTNNGLQYKEYPIAANASWIKLKIYMTFTGRNMINNVLLVNKPSKAIE